MYPVSAPLLLPQGSVQTLTGGAGRPAAVLLTGLGVPAESCWQAPLHEPEPSPGSRQEVHGGPPNAHPLMGLEIAGYTRVVSYDRAGQGGSTPPAAARDLHSFLDELSGVLGAVATPVVLVGHSLGGLIAYGYARRWPEQVAGLVLLDSSHPQQAVRFAALSSESQRVEEAAEWAGLLTDHPERPDLRDLLARPDMTFPGSLGDLPLAVVTRGIWPTLEEARVQRPDLTLAQHADREQVWRELQAEYARASSRAVHLQAEQSGHYVYLDQPALALSAVRQVWELARWQ